MGAAVEGVRLCPACGYGLEGLPEQDGKVRCPECGAEHHLKTMRQVGPWPSKVSVCWKFGGANVVLGAIWVALVMFANPVLVLLFPVLMLGTGVFVPMVTTIALLDRHALDDARARPYLFLFLLIIGWLVNVAIGVADVLLAIFILRQLA